MNKVLKIAGISLLSMMLNAAAAVIADYQFVDNASIPNSSDTDSLTTAGPFSAGAGVTLPTGTSALAVSNRSLLYYNNGFYAADETAALGASDYFFFSVSPSEGNQVSCNSLSFSTLVFPTTGDGAPRAYSLRVYGSGEWNIVGSGSIAVAATDDTSEPFSLNTIDLSGVATLQSQTNTMWFRLYFYDVNMSSSAANRQFRLDNVVVDGTVSAIPEPASIGLFGTALAGILLVRRRS